MSTFHKNTIGVGCISQNQAYTLLTTKYLVTPSEEEIQQISELFKDWLRSKNEGLLVHLFQIIDHHESEEVRELALDHIQRFLPSQKREQVLDLWISHPLPSLKPFIEQIIENYRDKIKTSTLAAAYVMLDRIDDLLELDPDFVALDSYLEGIDPSLGSLLYERVGRLKKSYAIKNPPSLFGQETPSIGDLISRKDYLTLWQSMLSFPFPYICEMMKFLYEVDWKPEEKESRRFFDLILEHVGTGGWKEIEDIMDSVLSIRPRGTNKYRRLTATEQRMKLIEIKLFPIVYTRPDRIHLMEFVSRGRYNLTDNTLGLYIYQERIRHSSFTGKIHIPIYSSNGVQLAEVIAVANSISSFNMDEDGLFFSINTKAGNYSVDLDAIAAFLLPFNQHTETVAEALDVLLEQTQGRKKLIFMAMKYLSDLQQGKSFSLFDLKQTIELENPQLSCCSLSIDMNDFETRFAIVPSDCDHELQLWKVPSMIYYESPNKHVVGNEILDGKVDGEIVDEALIFDEMLKSLIMGPAKTIRVQNLTINAEQAIKDFLNEIVKYATAHVDYQITEVVFSHQYAMPIRVQKWLNQVLEELGFNHVFSLETSIASLLGSYRIHKTTGNVLTVNIGEYATTLALAEVPAPKTKKRKERSLLEEIQPSPKVVVRRSVELGLNDLSKLVLEGLSLGILEKHKIIQSAMKSLMDNLEFQSKDHGLQLWVGTAPENPNNNEKFIDLESLECFETFKLALRDIFEEGLKVGIPKAKIDTIIFTGKGAKWPDFARYVFNIFDCKIPILVEDDEYLIAKGLGVFGNGQQIELPLHREIMVRINEEGLINFETLFSIKEGRPGVAKQFKIEVERRIKTIALDIWLRSLNYHAMLTEELEDRHLNHIKNDMHTFDNLTTFPKLASIESMQEPMLIACIDIFGRFGITVTDKNKPADIEFLCPIF